MTRLRQAVVFIGGSRDIAAGLQRSVWGNVRSLAQAGVVVPKTGRRTSNVNGLSHQRLASLPDAGWTALEEELGATDDDVALLVVPALLRLGVAPARHRRLVDRLARLADEVVVVSVVGDQLSLINEYYLHHVATWRTTGRMAAIAPKLFNNEVFVHERVLRPWYEEGSLRYVAVPQPVYDDGDPVEVVLAAAGARTRVEDLVPGAPRPASLGPVGVEANRLLGTYLRGLVPTFKPDATAVASASRLALGRAEKLGWCADEFWGWTRKTSNKALSRFDASNHRFAKAVWGSDWPVAYPLERPCTQAELLDLDVAAIDHISRYVIGTATRVARDLEAEE